MLKIITDSTTYMPYSFAKENNITVLPLTVLFNDVEFKEGFPGSFDAFFEDFKDTKKMGKTSQPSVGLFIDAYNEVINSGDEAICITISKYLSGTYETACMIKNQVDTENKISVIDSGSCCQSIWGLIQEIIELDKQGKSRQEIVAHIENMKKYSKVFFVPDSLDHLHHGGRISKLNAVLGNILQFKPMFEFYNSTLSIKKKVLGIQKAIKELVSLIPETAKKIFVLRIAKSKFYDMFFNKIKEKFSNIPVIESEVGPVMSIHVGPAIGVGYLAEK